jgi:hypothetical protein
VAHGDGRKSADDGKLDARHAELAS